jgi:hypothetical protein
LPLRAGVIDWNIQDADGGAHGGKRRTLANAGAIKDQKDRVRPQNDGRVRRDRLKRLRAVRAPAV